MQQKFRLIRAEFAFSCLRLIFEDAETSSPIRAFKVHEITCDGVLCFTKTELHFQVNHGYGVTITSF